MSALKQRISWVYGSIPVMLLGGLLYVISAASVASAADPSHIARKIRSGYTVMGSIDGAYSASVLAALGQKGIRCVCSRPEEGRVSVLVPEEAADDAAQILNFFGRSWHFSTN